jgi:hypothetical protein
MKNILIILVLLSVLSCKPEIRVIEKVRIDTIKVASPIIEDTLFANVINDTTITANKIKEKDTVVTVKYYPVEKKFYIKAKPDTVTLFKIDTVNTTKIIERKDSIIKIMFAMLIVLPLIVFIIFLIRLKG